MGDGRNVLWRGEAFGQTRRLVQYEGGISEQRLGADARWVALPGMPARSTLGVVARELHKLQAAAVEYRAAVQAGESLIRCMEESEPGVLDDDYYASNLRVSRADDALAALLPPPEEPAP